MGIKFLFIYVSKPSLIKLYKKIKKNTRKKNTKNIIREVKNFKVVEKKENKGFIKVSKDGVFLRDKASIFFAINDNLFVKWLNTYPTSVRKKFGGNRALSPADPDTILGLKLRKKWDIVFKKDTQKQQLAIKVLELEVKDKTKSGDLEYMVEATRWLNEGYHEKYSYLIDQDKGDNLYENEDYM